MREIILEKLSEIEQTHQVKILFACESGSRAWGFASPDSDYDVRFIYTHPQNHYLSIDTQRDVIELPVNEILDISGWDIKKSLLLFRKSNAVIYEWLQSPIIYQSNESFHKTMLEMMENCFCTKPGFHHYLSMTINTFNTDLQSDEVKLKKYFYALRPILAAKWILEKQTVPPMQFHLLRVLIEDPKIQIAIDELMEIKKDADEKKKIKPIVVLQKFISETIHYCELNKEKLTDKRTEISPLNMFFRNTIHTNDF